MEAHSFGKYEYTHAARADYDYFCWSESCQINITDMMWHRVLVFLAGESVHGNLIALRMY